MVWCTQLCAVTIRSHSGSIALEAENPPPHDQAFYQQPKKNKEYSILVDPLSYAAKPQSEILLKCFADVGEKCGENLAKNFSPILVLQFPGEVAARNFTKNCRQIRLGVKQNSFTARLWELGATTFSVLVKLTFE